MPSEHELLLDAKKFRWEFGQRRSAGYLVVFLFLKKYLEFNMNAWREIGIKFVVCFIEGANRGWLN